MDIVQKTTESQLRYNVLSENATTCTDLPFCLKHGVQRKMISVDNFFHIFEIIIFCFVVAICDLVHDVKTIFHLSYLLTASGNHF